MSERPRLSIAIVGAQRCGTTTLAWALAQHPDTSLGVEKEPHFFDDAEVQRSGLSDERITAHFDGVAPGRALIDATPAYLYLPGCLEALKRDSPEVSVVAILRDPAVRAISHYAHERRSATESHRISAALRRERKRLAQDFAPLDPGRYVKQIEHLFAVFPSAVVLRFAELLDAPQAVLDRVQRHVGLEPHPAVTLESVVAHRNSAGRTRGAQRAAARIRKSLQPETEKAELLLGWTPGSLQDGREELTIRRLVADHYRDSRRETGGFDG